MNARAVTMGDERAAGGEPERPFEIVNGAGDPRILFLCDHATNHIPPQYAALGLPSHELERHIAWDIGAAEVARGLAQAFGAPAILSRFSRLLIDPNRGEDDPTLVMKISDGAIVPGNAAADAAEVAARVARYWRPYDDAVRAARDRAVAAGATPALLSIHSFTPRWKGRARPWHVSVLWDRDERIARPLILRLRAEADLTIGDNEPYSGQLPGDTMQRHGVATGLPHALIEIRQDLIDTRHGVAEWTTRLTPIIGEALAMAGFWQARDRT